MVSKPNPKRSQRDELAPSKLAWYKRVPWMAIAITVAIILSSGLAVQPVRDAVSLGDVAEAYLVRPFAYVAIAPVSNILDTLILLSVRQHIALALGLLALFIVWRVVLGVVRSTTMRQHLVATAFFAVTLLATYAAGALLPRPMAALTSDNANILRVDFHSHTDASHDGRQDVEGNRAWHAASGFDVAYVTDHASVAGAERGIAANPRVASEGTMLLQGIEVTWTGEHVSILGAQRMYTGILTQNLRDVDVEGLRLASLLPGREPIAIWNHPHELNRLPTAAGPGTPGVRAIEIVNGAPDDMDAIRRNRPRIIAMAQERNLSLVAGSDNHGWGRAAPGWTLMRVFGWRGMSADAIATQVENGIRNGGFLATRVVERRVADPGESRAALAASVFTVPGRMLTTLSNDERIAWLVWTWGIVAGVWAWRRRRARSS
jgi:hypothetical protein